MSSLRVDKLIGAYPQHSDLLRRCRNAVYHFQKSPLDPRLADVLKDEDEEMSWSVALHFEFQGVLLQLAEQLRAGGPVKLEMAEALVRAIGWFPRHPYADEVERIQALCVEYEALVASDDSSAAEQARSYIASLRKEIAEMDFYPASMKLRRFKDAATEMPTASD